MKIINDTIIATIPEGCNSVEFDSTANGQWQIYFSDGITLKEIVEVKNGLRNGRCIVFYNNGQIKSKAVYKDEQLIGEYISFFDSGKIYMKGSYKIDKNNIEAFTGTITEYWDNGNMATQCSQKNNSYPLDNKYWDKDGNEIDREKYLKLWYDCN